MSDIPIGSPPVPPGRHAAPSGWYADPVDGQQERYWDGWQWSRNTRPREQAAGGPGSAPAGSAGGYGNPGAYDPSGSQGGYGAPPYGSGAPGIGPYGGGPQGNPYGQGQQPVPPGPYAGYPQPGRTPATAFTADGVPLAGWGSRVLALLIDNVVVSLVASLLTFRVLTRMSEQFMELMRQAMQGVPVDPTQVNGIFGADQYIVLGVTLAVGLVYHAGFLRWKGATPGKLAVGLRVSPVDRGQQSGPLGWSTILVRVGVCLIPGMLGILGSIFRLVDVLFPLWQPKRQALHDLAAKTQVVRAPGRR